MFEDACDLPSVGPMVADPEMFFDGLEKGVVVIFDEVHRIENPSRLLKIAADGYPNIEVAYR